MAQPELVKVWKGEQLSRTITVLDESYEARDLSDVTSFEVKGQGGLFALNLQAALGSNQGEVTLSSSATETEFAATGVYLAQIWGTRATGVTKEMLADIVIAVMEVPS